MTVAAAVAHHWLYAHLEHACGLCADGSCAQHTHCLAPQLSAHQGGDGVVARLHTRVGLVQLPADTHMHALWAVPCALAAVRCAQTRTAVAARLTTWTAVCVLPTG